MLIGSYDGSLYALAVKTGKTLWSLHTDGPVHATPAVQDGLTYVSGCDGVFRAIQIKDGKEVYQIKTGSYMGASPAILGDMFFVGTYANEVMGLDRKAKKVAWRYEHPTRKFPFYSSAAVLENRVILGGRDKIIRSLEFMSGELGENSWCMGTHFSLADITVGCALGYLLFRFPAIDWREKHPNLARLYDKLMRRAAFVETIPQG